MKMSGDQDWAALSPGLAEVMSGARVAVHSTLPDAGQLVAAGVDSIEHCIGLD